MDLLVLLVELLLVGEYVLSYCSRLWLCPFVGLEFIITVLICKIECGLMPLPKVTKSVKFRLHPQVHEVLKVKLVCRLSWKSRPQMGPLSFQFLLELFSFFPIVQKLIDNLLLAFVGDGCCQKLVRLSRLAFLEAWWWCSWLEFGTGFSVPSH